MNLSFPTVFAFTLVLASGLFLSPNCLAEANEDPAKFSAIDVFELEYVSDPQISPDGLQIVYVRRSSDIMRDRTRSNLWLVDTKSGEHRPLLSGNETFTSPRWSADGKRIAYLSNDSGSMQIRVRWMDTGATALVTNLATGPGSLTWSPDGTQIAFTTSIPSEGASAATLPPAPKGAEWAAPPKAIDSLVYRIDGQGFLESAYTHVFIVPADGGTPRKLTDGNYDHDGPLSFSPDGASLYFSANRNEDWEYETFEADIWKISLDSGTLEKVTDQPGSEATPALSPDGKYIAYAKVIDEGLSNHQSTLHVLTIEGSEVSELTADLDRSVDSLQWAANSKGIYFSADDHGKTCLYFQPLSGDRKRVADNLGGTSLGRPYTSGSYSVSSDDSIAYTLSRPDRPADLAYMATEGSDPDLLTTLNEDLLGHKQLGQTEPLTWPSSFDGLEIEGWLVTPPHFDSAKKYPLILEIHGGPHAAYGPHFSAEIQRYAAEGYVVLYCNPRGSTSYGREFAMQIDKSYPSADYDDLMSGVDAAIAKGFVDAERLYVTGGSGGGVLTAWIVGKTDRFQAAVVAKPVINWASFVLTADFSNYFSHYWFGEMPWENPTLYWEHSPLSLVANVTTPTMLLTGESDYRTPISESEQFYQALKLRRVETKMIRIPGASHGIAARPSHLVAKIENILSWFGAHPSVTGVE